MRTIQKTFSLEPMTSRMPSVLPAYKDNVLYYFDNESLRERDFKFPSNYGMIPLNLRLGGVTFVDGQLSATNGWDNVTLQASQCFCSDIYDYIRPCNARIPNELTEVCEYTDDNIEKHRQNNDLCDFTLSFERLSEWYHFFKEYYHLLNDYGHCDRTYSSATEYYCYESGTRYVDQMIYGTNEETYIALDEDFRKKGGEVNVGIIGVSGATDAGFYKWICDNIVPSYYISKEYTDYWKRTKLYYPDVIKWIAWFNERSWYELNEDGTTREEVYTATTYDNETNRLIEKEHWDCRQDGFDCCDCEEYFNRGGQRELERMLDWYNVLQDNITAMNETIKENIECFIPTTDEKIQLYNSLDDLGQYTIFSKEYELGIDYRTASYGDAENTHGGTVVEVSGNTMILKDGANGFCFSPYYMDKVYNEKAWENYTDKYMKDALCPICGYYGEIEDDTCPNCGYHGQGFLRNKNEFIADGYKFYAYDEDNVMYTGDNELEVKNKMSSAYTYDIISTDAILIDGVLYDIQRSEYGEYDWDNQYMSGKTFFVYREKDTSTPYTLVDGKKVYGELSQYSIDENGNLVPIPCYYFTFFKNKDQNKLSPNCGVIDRAFNITNYKQFGRRENEDDVIYYITYLGKIFKITGDSLVIDEEETEFPIAYPRVFGYVYDKDGNLMYIIRNGENKIVVDSELLNEIPNSRIDGDRIIIGLDYEPTIYSAKELSGHTVSRLTDLESTDILIDDIGNKVDGKYNPNKVIFEGDEGYNSNKVNYCLMVKGEIYAIYDTQVKATEAKNSLKPEDVPNEIKKCNSLYNHQPPQGTELDLLYEVGNTSNIRRIKGLTKEDVDEFETYDDNEPNYFIGNIITSMVFYYKDDEGNVVESTIKSGGTQGCETSLKAIKASQTARKTIEEDTGNTIIFDGEDIYCDVTYYIGATLGRKKNKDFYLAYSANVETNNYNYGVEYKETVKFVKENREYYLKKMIGKQIPTSFNSPSAHTVSYPVYVYKLTQEMTDIEADIYGTYFESPLAVFKTEINLINDDLTSNYSGYKDMSAYNNIHVSPVFKQEYMLGISSLENIDSDIYIERGINAAFEKHLKLGEVTSMEALEQYSNGYFKIIEN